METATTSKKQQPQKQSERNETIKLWFRTTTYRNQDKKEGCTVLYRLALLNNSLLLSTSLTHDTGTKNQNDPTPIILR